MKTDARRLPTAPLALAAALLAAFLVLVAPLSASAHDSLTASSPEAGSTVETLPAELTLTFSAKLIDGEGATEVVVTDASGASVTDGPATVNGAVVTQPLVAEAAAGAYTVLWRVVSSDGHPISEEFGFTVTTSTLSAPTATPETAAPETAEPTEPEQTAAPAPTSESTDGSTAPEESSASTAWIWILAIAGVLVVVVAVVIAFALRGRGSSASERSTDPSAADSDAPSER